MSEQSGKSDVDYARQLQEKFELYLLGLIFTLLALAIQTAKFGVSDWADAFELEVGCVSWCRGYLACLVLNGYLLLSIHIRSSYASKLSFRK
jgi:hypothetical protein